MSSKSGVGEVTGKRKSSTNEEVGKKKSSTNEEVGKKKSSTNEEAGKRKRVADTVVKILTPYYQNKRITSKVRDFREVGEVEEGRLRWEGGRRDKGGEEWGGGSYPFRFLSILKQLHTSFGLIYYF